MKIKTILIALTAAVAMTALVGCRSKAADGANGKPTVVATIFSDYDALRTIGGADVNCVILLPPLKSPHEYVPTIPDRVSITKAKLVVKNGLMIDNWVDKLLDEAPSAVVVDVGQVVKEHGIQPLRTEELSVTPASETKPDESEDVSADNPHIWLDPRVQAMAAEAIRDALVKMDPAHKDGYESRAKAYLDDLRKLDQDFAQAAKGFKQKDFIGFHSAYAYLARRYGLNQVASVEELPDEGPSAAQLKNIIKLIQEKHIKVVFTETAFEPKAMNRLVDETGVKTGVLQPIETYESLDETYVDLMRENLKALEAALM